MVVAGISDVEDSKDGELSLTEDCMKAAGAAWISTEEGGLQADEISSAAKLYGAATESLNPAVSSASALWICPAEGYADVRTAVAVCSIFAAVRAVKSSSNFGSLKVISQRTDANIEQCFDSDGVISGVIQAMGDHEF